jgi:hypothetical protein
LVRPHLDSHTPVHGLICGLVTLRHTNGARRSERVTVNVMDALTHSSAYAKPRHRSLALLIIGALILFSLQLLPRFYKHFRAAATPTTASQLTACVEQKKFSVEMPLHGNSSAQHSKLGEKAG